MSRRDEQRLADILAACDELELVSERGRLAFDSDPLIRRAAERLLEIVGESANALSEESKARFETIPWRESPLFESSWRTITTVWILIRSGRSSLTRSPLSRPRFVTIPQPRSHMDRYLSWLTRTQARIGRDEHR